MGLRGAAPAVLLGILASLAVSGYQFGQSNHTVYLVDALRASSPDLLRNDWYTSQTLQYHGAFSLLSRGLMRAGVLEAGFLVGYLALVVLLHIAWFGIVRSMGGEWHAYLLSVFLFYVSAAGVGLGAYQFLQDSAFLPSNVANVAMLWGIWLWMRRRLGGAGTALGLAGLLHLNYALVAIALWLVMGIWSIRERDWRTFAIGTIPLLVLCMLNIVPAMRVALAASGGMPLSEFVDLYVRLRHPHHYDPSSWPVLLWVSFLWPIPFLLLEGRAPARPVGQEPDPPIVLLFFSALLILALLGAGIWYASESLIQMSLWRFSIFVKLLTCIAAALFISRRAPRWAVITSCVLILLAAVGFRIARGHWITQSGIPEDGPAYAQLCDWAGEHTPRDAVFLVPPQEQIMRLRGQRAIVINFKGVPQLSAELPVWRDRFRDVLEMDDLRVLPRPFPRTFDAIRERYESRSPQHLVEVARRYGARYIVTQHRIESLHLVFSNDSWFLYDLLKQDSEGGGAVERSDVQKRVLERYGIRLEAEMSDYVVDRLSNPESSVQIPVMGGDARTGVPVRQSIELSALTTSSPR